MQIEEKLIIEWKKMRGAFFNVYDEDRKKFEKAYSHHPLYYSVIKHLDKSFMEVNQLAISEIQTYINSMEKENDN